MKFLMALLLVLILFLSGCATTAGGPPQAVAVEVSRPCAALASVKPPPELHPLEELQALGGACMRDGDGEACYQFVIALATDRQALVAWAAPASAAIEGCKQP